MRFFLTGILFLYLVSGFPQDDGKQKLLEVYGQLMTDFGYNFDQINPVYFDVVRPSQLPSHKNEYGPDGNFWFSVRQTYLGLKGYYPTRWGEIKTLFEFDLYGLGPNVGQTTFHLTKVWVEFRHFGFGRHWSVFVNKDIYPNIIEYWGPNGMALCPNLQIRWMPIMGDHRLTLALERPGASVDEGIYRDRIEIENIKMRLPVPDLSISYRRTGKFGYTELAGIVRYIQWKDILPDSIDYNGHVVGWGLNLNSKILISNALTGKFQFVYGEAIENYMNDGPVDVAIEENPSDISRPAYGVGLPVLGVSTFMDIQWNTHFSSSIGYSMSGIFNSNGQEPSAFRYGHYALINLLYYPVPNAMAGIELQYGSRSNYADGWNAKIVKIQFSVRYLFSHVFYQSGTNQTTVCQ
ncbi:MAG: hypothetical protein PHD25_12100 [Bacteroidales bacterium]|nr:hypothetical protein [Bacteroidales bacterium]